MKRKGKKGVIYALKYTQGEGETVFYKVGCSVSKNGVKRRLAAWNKIMEMKGEIYMIQEVKDKFLEEKKLIWYLWETNRCFANISIELFYDVEEEINQYISSNFK